MLDGQQNIIHETLEGLASSTYDPVHAYRMYHRLQSYRSKDSLDKAFAAIFPLFGNLKQSRKVSRLVFRYGEDDVISCAAIGLYIRLRQLSSVAEGSSIDDFTTKMSFVLWAATYRQLSKLEKSYGLTFDFSYRGADPVAMGRVVSHSDVEAKLMLESMPTTLWKGVMAECRFKDKYRSEICAYILSRLIHGNKPVPAMLRFRFKLNPERSAFFYDYVVVISRLLLIDMSKALFGGYEDDPFLFESGPVDRICMAAA